MKENACRSEKFCVDRLWKVISTEDEEENGSIDGSGVGSEKGISSGVVDRDLVSRCMLVMVQDWASKGLVTIRGQWL